MYVSQKSLSEATTLLKKDTRLSEAHLTKKNHWEKLLVTLCKSMLIHVGEVCLKSYNMLINIPDSTNKLLNPAIGPTQIGCTDMKMWCKHKWFSLSHLSTDRFIPSGVLGNTKPRPRQYKESQLCSLGQTIKIYTGTHFNCVRSSAYQLFYYTVLNSFCFEDNTIILNCTMCIVLMHWAILCPFFLQTGLTHYLVPTHAHY